MIKLTTKLTTEIDTELYDRITKGMHHGQLSKVIRGFAISLDQLLQSEEKENIYLWLYAGKPLMLPPPKEE